MIDPTRRAKRFPKPTRRALLLPAGEGWPLPPRARRPMRNDADGMEGRQRGVGGCSGGKEGVRALTTNNGS